MYLLIKDKLYCKQEDVYKSIDILNGQLVFNGIETKNDTIGGLLLTYSEVYRKFNINPAMPQMGSNYMFPRNNSQNKEPEPTEEVVETKPKSSNKK